MARPRRRSSLLFGWSVGQSSPSGLSFTGGAGRTYLDSNGALQSVGTNVPRLNAYVLNSSSVLVPGWLLEGASTNHFLQSGTPATQTTSSLATGTYTVWLVGTGQIVVSAGTATITGAGTATAAAPVTFVVTVAGTVVYTVSGSPTRAQAENLPFPTSYIPTTTVAVTRSAEVATVPFPYAPMAMTAYVKAVYLGHADRALQISTGDVPPRFAIYNAAVGAFHDPAGTLVSSTAAVTPAIGDVIETAGILSGTGTVAAAVSKNGGAEVDGATSGAQALAATWGATPLLNIAYQVSGGNYFLIQSFKIARGAQSLAYMKAA